MRDILPALRGWYDAGQSFGLATVVAVSQSAPRQPGATMAVGPGGVVVGSLSGGCVDSAVFDLGREVVATGRAQLTTYGYSDDDAFAIGLTCGGAITVLVRPVSARLEPHFGVVAASVAAAEPVAVATVLSGPVAARTTGATMAVWSEHTIGSLGVGRLDAAVAADARRLFATGRTGQRHYGVNGEPGEGAVTVFVQAFTPPPRMLVFGAVDFAAALTRVGVLLGYRVSVCDARAVFATAARFPEADEVVVDWPHRYLAGTSVEASTVICVLTHDPKFDIPLLEVALRTDAGYVGAMGSRRAHAQRLAGLRAAGLGQGELARLHSPVGLDIGARTPEETAVSIAAEIIASRCGGSGTPLRATTGAIHAARVGRMANDYAGVRRVP